MAIHRGSRHPHATTPPAEMPHYYQYHLENPGADVLIAAWRCPIQAPAGASATWFERNCTLPLKNVDFAVVQASDQPDSPAMHPQVGIPSGQPEIRITGISGPGFARKPYMQCEVVPTAEQHAAGERTPIDTIRCNWYTWQLEPGEITVYAWECPEDYDFSAPQADPMADCIGVARDTHFQLHSNHAGTGLHADNGDDRNGGIRFGNLQPGIFTIAAITSTIQPDDDVLWQCFGFEEGSVRSTAVSHRADLSLGIQGGEHIMCHRFHRHHRGENVAR